MEKYNEMENKLIKMVKEKEQADRQLLKLEMLIGVLSCFVILLPVIIQSLLPIEKEWIRTVVVLLGLIPGTIGLFIAVKLEQMAGYYECQECGHRYVPTYKAVVFASHMGRTRRMKCPKCGKKSWQKKVLSRGESD